MPQLQKDHDRPEAGGVVSDGWIANADGGARGNPGPGAAGIVVRAPDGTVACAGGAFLGTVTNNVAEYEALLWAMRVAQALGARVLELRADSELVVRQMNGQYRVKSPGLKPLFAEAQRLRRGFESVSFVHVPRGQNAEADAWANEAMDTSSVVGDAPRPPGGELRTLFD